MMIAQRFRAIGYVAIVALAAVVLYLISLQVAAERGRLEAVEAQIAQAKREMRQLQTELGTRASMRQLEKWNGEVLALAAPRAEQYVQSGAQLASLNLDAIEQPSAAKALPPVAVAAAKPQPKAPVDAAADLRNANFIKPAEEPRLQKVAMINVSFERNDTRRAEAGDRKRP